MNEFLNRFDDQLPLRLGAKVEPKAAPPAASKVCGKCGYNTIGHPCTHCGFIGTVKWIDPQLAGVESDLKHPSAPKFEDITRPLDDYARAITGIKRIRPGDRVRDIREQWCGTVLSCSVSGDVADVARDGYPMVATWETKWLELVPAARKPADTIRFRRWTPDDLTVKTADGQALKFVPADGELVAPAAPRWKVGDYVDSARWWRLEGARIESILPNGMLAVQEWAPAHSKPGEFYLIKADELQEHIPF